MEPDLKFIDDISKTIDEVVKWDSKKFKDKDPLEFCKEKYPGVTRGELSIVDPKLYHALWKNDRLEDIPVLKDIYAKCGPHPNKSEISDAIIDFSKLSPEEIAERNRLRREDPLECYNLYYKGVTRGKLFLIANSLYHALRNRDLLKNVPLSFDNSGDPLEEYKEKYDGVSRGRLERLDPPLFRRIKRAGLLEQVPLEKELVAAGKVIQLTAPSAELRYAVNQ